jgi:hypothetical protein
VIERALRQYKTGHAKTPVVAVVGVGCIGLVAGSNEDGMNQA